MSDISCRKLLPESSNVLDANEADALRVRVGAATDYSVAAEVGVSRGVVCRAIARLPIRRASLLAIRLYLAKTVRS